MTEVQTEVELIERWLEWMSVTRGCSRATVHKYRGYMAWLREFVKKGLLQATLIELEEFCGVYLHKRGQSPMSRRAVVACVRRFYQWAAKTRQVQEDPSRGLEYPRTGSPLPVAMGLGNAEKLLMQPDLHTFVGVRDAAILAVLIGTGCRLSGVVNLNQGDLIWYTNENGAERLTLKLCEKGKKERLVPAPVETGLMIRAYLGHPDLKKINRVISSGDQVLFVNLHNPRVKGCDHYGEARRIGKSGIDDMVRRYAKAAGLPAEMHHAHALRHLYGTELAEAEVGLDVRAALLGHSRTETTVIYSHMAQRRLAAAVEKANPMNRIRTPVTDLARELERRTKA